MYPFRSLFLECNSVSRRLNLSGLRQKNHFWVNVKNHASALESLHLHFSSHKIISRVIFFKNLAFENKLWTINYGPKLSFFWYLREFAIARCHWASWKSWTANVLLLFKGIIMSFFTIVDNWELSANLSYQ